MECVNMVQFKQTVADIKFVHRVRAECVRARGPAGARVRGARGRRLFDLCDPRNVDAGGWGGG